MGKVNEIDGYQYVEVEREAFVGEKVIVIGGFVDSCNMGQIYTVIEKSGGMEYTDGTFEDESQLNLTSNEYHVLEPVEPTKSIEDLLANLSRKVVELESELKSVKNIANKALSATGNHGAWLIRNQERLVALESEPEVTFTPEQVAALMRGVTND